MQTLNCFAHLIEYHCLRRTAAALASTLLMALASWSNGAMAQRSEHKIAHDLRASIDARHGHKDGHTRELKGVRHVQAIVVTDGSNGSDADMSELRAFILKHGGSVHASFPSMHSLSVQIKASQVQALAERKEVLSVTPNREIRSTASTIETITGALNSGVRTYSDKINYSGLDGSGIGIAILDSGVMKMHDTLKARAA